MLYIIWMAHVCMGGSWKYNMLKEIGKVSLMLMYNASIILMQSPAPHQMKKKEGGYRGAK